MLSLANFVMRGRRNAILIALLFSLIPLMGWVADVIMALVTLRKGAKEGALVLIWIMLPSLLLALKGYPQFLLYNALAGSVITYGFAVVLRQTISWTYVLQAAVIIGVLEIMVVHLVLPNLDANWSRELLINFALLKKQLLLQATDADVRYWANLLSKIITGFQITFFFIYDLIIVGLARWVQAKLYNPAGLRPELTNIRLGIVAIILFVLVIIGTFAGNNTVLDCLCIVFLPFIVAGLSLSHWLAETINISGFWFIGFYGLFILFLPYCAVLLTVFALADSWFNFRQRIKLKN